MLNPQVSKCWLLLASFYCSPLPQPQSSSSSTFTLQTYLLSHFSRVQFFATPWTVAHQAPLFMGFSRQEYWSGLPCPPPGDLPDPGIELNISHITCIGRWVFFFFFFTTSATWEARQLGSPISPLKITYLIF